MACVRTSASSFSCMSVLLVETVLAFLVSILVRKPS